MLKTNLMKKTILIITLLFALISCNVPTPPFKEGDVAYMKLDSSKVIILLNLGQVQDNVFLYRVSHKNNYGHISSTQMLSSGLFK